MLSLCASPFLLHGVRFILQPDLLAKGVFLTLLVFFSQLFETNARFAEPELLIV